MSHAVLSTNPRAENAATPTVHPAPASSALSPFTAPEIASFNEADRSVARMIVCIMCGIFTVGLVLYTIIAWLAAGGSH